MGLKSKTKYTSKKKKKIVQQQKLSIVKLKKKKINPNEPIFLSKTNNSTL